MIWMSTDCQEMNFKNDFKKLFNDKSSTKENKLAEMPIPLGIE